MEESKEWVYETMGFKIAMVSRGRRWRPGVLFLHGHGDSAATFAPLVRLLPDTYYYVSFDFPGHGKSDFLPAGPIPTHTFPLEVIRRVVQHLQWETFICVGHSMGGVLGMLHNHLHPGQITKLICLDPLYALMFYTGMTDHDNEFISTMFYQQYYDVKLIFSQPKISSYEEALNSAMQLRNLERKQAEEIVARNLTSVGEGLYRVSPQKVVFKIPPIPVSTDIVEHIFRNISLPILVFHTSQALSKYRMVHMTSEITKLFDDKSNKYKVVCVEGVHDQHFIRPELFVADIVEFLGHKSKM